MKQRGLTKQAVAKTKALAKWVTGEVPQPQVPIHKPSYAKRQGIDPSQISQIEQSYNQLDGEWLDWLGVARKYESKVPSLDRYDVRHDILIELARARRRDGKPIPLLRAYRIASLTVAHYWRLRLKREVKVCVYNGVATEPKCATCRHKPKAFLCPYLASRPIQSLDQPATDNELTLMDTVADDTAIEAVDIDAGIDATQWLLGCPIRLIEVAKKRKDGTPLDGKDRKYLCKMLKRYQKTLF